LFSKDSIELVKARGSAGNVCDSFVKWFDLFGDYFYIAVQRRDTFFEGKE